MMLKQLVAARYLDEDRELQADLISPDEDDFTRALQPQNNLPANPNLASLIPSDDTLGAAFIGLSAALGYSYRRVPGAIVGSVVGAALYQYLR